MWKQFYEMQKQNSNCYNFQDHWVEEDQTPTPTKQAPRRQQVLRYLNIKFYATSTKTQNAGGEEEDASESRHGGENEDENNKDKSFKKADSTSQPKTIITTSLGRCVSCDTKVSKNKYKEKVVKLVDENRDFETQQNLNHNSNMIDKQTNNKEERGIEMRKENNK